MTAKELASLLDGREYMREISESEISLAKENELLVIFGRSDDLCELRGAIDDELDCYEGGALKHPALPDAVIAVWCPDERYSWGYKTALPHYTFRIYEDGEPYCIGIVADLALALSERYWCEQCCNFDREHVGPDGYAACRFTGIPTYAQTYGKECRGFNTPPQTRKWPLPCTECAHYEEIKGRIVKAICTHTGTEFLTLNGLDPQNHSCMQAKPKDTKGENANGR